MERYVLGISSDGPKKRYLLLGLYVKTNLIWRAKLQHYFATFFYYHHFLAFLMTVVVSSRKIRSFWQNKGQNGKTHSSRSDKKSAVQWKKKSSELCVILNTAWRRRLFESTFNCKMTIKCSMVKLRFSQICKELFI